MKRVFLILSLFAAFACGDDSSPPPTQDTGVRDDRVQPDEGMAECDDDERLCELAGRTQCTPVLRNPLNCGGCGVQCEADETCDEGTCRTADACDPGQTDCGGELGCVDTDTNVAACGSCDIECAEGEACTRGACTPAECDAASETPDRCNEVCVNTQNDLTNCGSCGNMCMDGQRCSEGACVDSCGGTVCESDGASECVDTDTDATNCGACGMACATGQACVGGSCACDGELCDGACTDTDSDPNNCGACGAPCEEGQTCETGRCVCPSGTAECRGECVNTATDSANCGACGTACADGQACVASSCVDTGCPSGQIECGGSCTDVNSNDANCGACGTTCSADQACRMGNCRPLNDIREGAVTLTFPVTGSELTIAGSTTGATADVPVGLACSANGPNVWYRISVDTRGALWVDTAGSSYDTALFVVDSSGEPVTGFCNDDCPCGSGGDFTTGLQSCMAASLRAGEYFISVGGFSSAATGDFVMHVQFLPSDNASFFYSSRLDGMDTTFATRLIGTSASQSATSCGGNQTSRSGEDMRWVAACGTGADHSFSVCPSDGGSWTNDDADGDDHDPVIYRISAQTGMQQNCNDTGFINPFRNCRPEGGGPNNGARIIDDDELERGLHGIIIDSAGEAGSGMRYELAYEVPALEFVDD